MVPESGAPDGRPRARRAAAGGYAHVYPFFVSRETERFVSVVCDIRYKVIATEVIAEGLPDAVDVRIVDIFALAIRHRAVALLVAHNHPSGDPTPSEYDYELAKSLLVAGELLDIRLIDPDRRPGRFLHASACLPLTWTRSGERYRRTSETLVALLARSSQRSKVARSVHASIRASSSLLGVSCRRPSTRRREARVAVS